MMSKHDMDILNRCHEDALKEMASAAADIAETVCDGKWPSKDQVDKYKLACIGVNATRKDLENCISMELDEILNP